VCLPQVIALAVESKVSSSRDAGLEEAQHLRLWVCLLQVIALGASAMQILGLALVGDGVNGALAGELRGQKLQMETLVCSIEALQRLKACTGWRCTTCDLTSGRIARAAAAAAAPASAAVAAAREPWLEHRFSVSS